jgi:hypoxanthine phosphoribosyltransferase
MEGRMIAIASYDESIERVLFSRQEIAAAIEALAKRIASDYAGRSLLMLGVLKGALHVATDLARAIATKPDGPSEIIVEYVCVSSYGNQTRSSGEVRLLKDTSVALGGRDILLVEDIVDNGLTLAYLRALFLGRKPASVRSCVLFDKPYHRRVDVPVEYIGLTTPDAFVVGYGLDYQELFRNLPYLAQLRPAVFSKEG